MSRGQDDKWEKTFRIAAIAWIVGIFLLSVTSPPSLPTNEWIGTDKIAHFGAYGLLAWLILGGWQKAFFSNNKSYIFVIVFVSLYGLGIEFIQGFLPDRYFEIPDIIANIMGGFVGAITYPLILFSSKKIDS